MLIRQLFGSICLDGFQFYMPDRLFQFYMRAHKKKEKKKSRPLHVVRVSVSTAHIQSQHPLKKK